MRFSQAAAYINEGTITDGVEIDAPGILLTNSSSGRIIGGARFLQGGSTLVNELGGIVRVADGASDISTVAVTGSAGNDTFVNNGLIRGLVKLGEGNDRYVKGPESTGTDSVDLGAGDDVLERIGTSGWVSAKGGTGWDRAEWTVTSQTAVNGAGLYDFEELVLTGNGQFSSFSGYQSIRLGAPQEWGLALLSSANPLVDLALEGNSLRLHESTLRSVTGGAAAEHLEIGGSNSAISGAVDLGGGDDQLTLSNWNGAAPALPAGGADGGEGTDTFRIVNYLDGSAAYDLATVTGFERLQLNTNYQAAVAFDIAHANGLEWIALGSEAQLTLRSSHSPGASLYGGLGGSIRLEADSAAARYEAFGWAGFPTQPDRVQGDDTLSLQFVNEGQVLGTVLFFIGDDLYDGSAGFVGGTVYGNAGNDTLIGGSAAERFEGGYGADRLFGGGGADILLGGAGKDIFGGTMADLAGDEVRDFAAGDRIRVTDAALDSFAWQQVGKSVQIGSGALTLATGNALRLAAQASAEGGVDLVFANNISAGDASGDGLSDIAWRHADGTLTTWNGAEGGFDGATGFALSISQDWNLIDRADVNGDGRADLLWRNDNGMVTQWLAAGSGFDGAGQPSLMVSLDWQTAGTGDFNGDGVDDLLWRHDDGRVTRWLGVGHGFDGAAQPTLSVSNDWSIAGTGDFDGDGIDDILWQNEAGLLTRWLGTVDGFDGAGQPALLMPPEWQVVGVGDFNGDGCDDVLSRAPYGSVTRYLGGDDSFQAGEAILTIGSDWQVAAIGDYNGDAIDDILWRNTDGSLTTWEGTPSGFEQATGVFEQVDLAWSIVGG